MHWSLGTASMPELTWTAIALAGAAVNIWALWDAVGDYYYLKASRTNGPREIVARGNVREEAIRVFIQTVFIMIGVAAMASPAGTRSGEPSSLAYVTLFGFSTAAVLMMVKGLLARSDRRALLRAIGERLDSDGDGAGAV